MQRVSVPHIQYVIVMGEEFGQCRVSNNISVDVNIVLYWRAILMPLSWILVRFLCLWSSLVWSTWSCDSHEPWTTCEPTRLWVSCCSVLNPMSEVMADAGVARTVETTAICSFSTSATKTWVKCFYMFYTLIQRLIYLTPKHVWDTRTKGQIFTWITGWGIFFVLSTYCSVSSSLV